MISDTTQHTNHTLWQQIVSGEKRDNHRFKNYTQAYDFEKNIENLKTIQDYQMKRSFYGKHLNKYMRQTGIDPISHDSPQKDLLRETSLKHFRINSFSPLQRTEYVNHEGSKQHSAILRRAANNSMASGPSTVVKIDPALRRIPKDTQSELKQGFPTLQHDKLQPLFQGSMKDLGNVTPKYSNIDSKPRYLNKDHLKTMQTKNGDSRQSRRSQSTILNKIAQKNLERPEKLKLSMNLQTGLKMKKMVGSRNFYASTQNAAGIEDSIDEEPISAAGKSTIKTMEGLRDQKRITQQQKMNKILQQIEGENRKKLDLADEIKSIMQETQPGLFPKTTRSNRK